jgi:hypothetical protein
MSEIPNPKHQIPNKFEIPNLNVPNVRFWHVPAGELRVALRGLESGIWNLEFVWNLELGVWDLIAAVPRSGE